MKNILLLNPIIKTIKPKLYYKTFYDYYSELLVSHQMKINVFIKTKNYVDLDIFILNIIAPLQNKLLQMKKFIITYNELVYSMDQILNYIKYLMAYYGYKPLIKDVKYF